MLSEPTLECLVTKSWNKVLWFEMAYICSRNWNTKGELLGSMEKQSTDFHQLRQLFKKSWRRKMCLGQKVTQFFSPSLPCVCLNLGTRNTGTLSPTDKNAPFTIFHKRFKVCSWDRPEKSLYPHGTIAADLICSQVTTWLGSKALCWGEGGQGGPARRANAITGSRVCCVIRLVGYVFSRASAHTHTRRDLPSFPRFRTIPPPLPLLLF